MSSTNNSNSISTSTSNNNSSFISEVIETTSGCSACDDDNELVNNNNNNINNRNNYDTLLKKRVLSIQSHVVSGYVGNKSAVFPLQLLGFDVDVINSVQFSNHTGYTNGFEGDVLTGIQLTKLFTGLQRNNLVTDIGFVLTGYIGSESFLLSVIDIVSTLKGYNDNSNDVDNNNCTRNFWHKSKQSVSGSSVSSSISTSIRYICDPVLGDQGKLYVPASLVQLYITKVLPLADVITPNQFEVEQLTGIRSITTINDAITACQVLHTMGPTLVFITSLVLQDDNQPPSTLSILASFFCTNSSSSSCNTSNNEQQSKIWQIHCPILPGQYTGTGDVTAALLLAHTALLENELYTNERNNNNNNNHNNNKQHLDEEIIVPMEDRIIPQAMERVINTMFAMLVRTDEHSTTLGTNTTTCLSKTRELRLIQCKDLIEQPPHHFKCTRIR